MKPYLSPQKLRTQEVSSFCDFLKRSSKTFITFSVTDVTKLDPLRNGLPKVSNQTKLVFSYPDVKKKGLILYKNYLNLFSGIFYPLYKS